MSDDRKPNQSRRAGDDAARRSKKMAKKKAARDESGVASRYDDLDVGDVLRFRQDEKPETTDVAPVGRNAKDELLEVADLATETELLKHPFRYGVKAQRGLAY